MWLSRFSLYKLILNLTYKERIGFSQNGILMDLKGNLLVSAFFFR